MSPSQKPKALLTSCNSVTFTCWLFVQTPADRKATALGGQGLTVSSNQPLCHLGSLATTSAPVSLSPSESQRRTERGSFCPYSTSLNHSGDVAKIRGKDVKLKEVFCKSPSSPHPHAFPSQRPDIPIEISAPWALCSLNYSLSGSASGVARLGMP